MESDAVKDRDTWRVTLRKSVSLYEDKLKTTPEVRKDRSIKLNLAHTNIACYYYGPISKSKIGSQSGEVLLR